jgi:hypothetical protein
MEQDLADYVGDYAASEYFAFLDGPVRAHAQPLLDHFLREAVGLEPGFPAAADARLFCRVLTERVARLDLPVEVRRGVPGLLSAFFQYLAASGRYPPAASWLDWLPAVEERYLAIFRPDGSARGETVRRRFPAVGRNDPCPCGSGSKFKKCCMRLFT